jgi:hypothetical protein
VAIRARVSGFRVLLSKSAAETLEALGSRPRGMLIMALGAVAAWEPRVGLLNLWVADQFAACEVIASDRIVLVYAIRSISALRVALYGEPLERRVRRRDIQRTIHGKGRRR